MASAIKFEYKDVSDFSRNLNKKISSKQIDNIFINSCKVAMENTLSEAEAKTPVVTGELYASWRKDVERPERNGNSFS